MSNIYIQEPPTKGKVVLKTSLGEITVELWSKECPKACRNFIQLCMEGYYDGTIFHRVIKDFIAQGGDPTGTGEGGESIYGKPFKDEFHQRLRFNRRGLLAMANSEKDDNESQFFFTLAATPELNKKHTLFGKIADNTIFNMIKLNECECIDERPLRPVKIISTEIIYNPFDDIKPRNLKALYQKNEEKETIVKKGVKNFGLLSFGDEAEDEEEELETLSTKFKSKSAHDIGDPSLISKKITETIHESSSDDRSSSEDQSDSEVKHKKRKINEKVVEEKSSETKQLELENIKSKLKKPSDDKKASQVEPALTEENKKDLKIKQTQDEIKKLQKELATSQKNKIAEEKEQIEKIKEKKEETEVVLKYKEEKEKYEHLKKKKIQNAKEEKTLELLNKFRERLFKAKDVQEDGIDDDDEASKKSSVKVETINESTDSLKAIFNHRLEIDEEIKQKVIDANIADNDRYDIYDPRNPLNKRRLEESRQAFKEKKGHVSSSSSSRSNHHSSSSHSKRN